MHAAGRAVFAVGSSAHEADACCDAPTLTVSKDGCIAPLKHSFHVLLHVLIDDFFTITGQAGPVNCELMGCLALFRNNDLYESSEEPCSSWGVEVSFSARPNES